MSGWLGLKSAHATAHPVLDRRSRIREITPGNALDLAEQNAAGHRVIPKKRPFRIPLSEHGEFGRLLREVDTPAEALARIESPGFVCADQWQVQIQARIQRKADVYVHADGLSDEEITQCLLRPCPRIEDTLAELLSRADSRHSTVCVMPEGPLTIPYVSSQ